MKLFLMGLLVAGIQQWVATAAAHGCDEKQKTKKVVVVTDDKAVVHGKCCDKAAHGRSCVKAAHGKCCDKGDHSKCCDMAGHGKCCDMAAHGQKCCGKDAHGKPCGKERKGNKENVFTIVTTGDGPGETMHIASGDKKVIRKKKCVKIGADDEDKAVAIVTVVGEGHGDGRSEPGGLWFGTSMKFLQIR